MVGKIIKHIATALAILSMGALSLPIFSTHVADGVALDLVIRGYNLVEFSPWGVIVLLTPPAMLGLMLSKLNNTVKTIGLLGLILLDGAALCGGVSAAYRWMYGVSGGSLESHVPCAALYVLLLGSAAVGFWLTANISSVGKWLQTFFIEEEEEKQESRVRVVVRKRS